MPGVGVLHYEVTLFLLAAGQLKLDVDLQLQAHSLNVFFKFMSSRMVAFIRRINLHRPPTRQNVGQVFRKTVFFKTCKTKKHTVKTIDKTALDLSSQVSSRVTSSHSSFIQLKNSLHTLEVSFSPVWGPSGVQRSRNIYRLKMMHRIKLQIVLMRVVLLTELLLLTRFTRFGKTGLTSNKGQSKNCHQNFFCLFIFLTV